MAVVAMAAEEDTIVPSDVHHSLNDEAQKSIENDDVQVDFQGNSNSLEQGDNGDTELSKSIQGVEESITIESSKQPVGVAEDTSAKNSHTPTPCKSSNYLQDVIMQATPTCSMEPGLLEHVDSGLEPVAVHNASDTHDHVTSGELGGGTTAEKDGEYYLYYC